MPGDRMRDQPGPAAGSPARRPAAPGAGLATAPARRGPASPGR